MFDSKIRPLIDPSIQKIAKKLVDRDMTANILTGAGFVFALMTIASIAYNAYYAALVFLAFNRLIDGLDGEVARQKHGKNGTALGAYIDICSDFFLYGGVVFAFAFAYPQVNALPAAFLLFSYIGGSAVTFLAFAIQAEKKKLKSDKQGKKGFFYMSGLAEGTETIFAMALMCLFPAYFPVIAIAFACICWLTGLGRTIEAFKVLK